MALFFVAAYHKTGQVCVYFATDNQTGTHPA